MPNRTGMLNVDGQPMQVEYAAELACPKCKNKLFRIQAYVNIVRPVPVDANVRLKMAAEDRNIMPCPIPAGTEIFCIGCGRKIREQLIQKQLYPEIAKQGNGNGKK